MQEDKLKRPYCCATNLSTMKLEHPFEASKDKKYSCPDCTRKIKFCKGEKNVPYFSHYKSTNPCNFFEKPSESEKHSNAKNLLRDRLLQRDPLLFYSECKRCDEKINHPISYSEHSTPVLEYQFVFNGKKRVADVVLLNGNEIEIVFEIYSTHKTNANDRPEPWYEIKADDMLTLSKIHGKYEYKCIRNSVCQECIDKQNEEIERLVKEKELYTKKWECLKEEIREKERKEREEEDRILNKKAIEIYKKNMEPRLILNRI